MGLWIRASWGAVLLLGATTIEVGLFLSGNPNVQMDIPGFILRVLLVAAMAAMLLLSFRLRRAQD